MRPIRILLVASFLAACAPVYESRYPYDEGWRAATVTEVAPGDELLVAATNDCRLGLPAAMVVGNTFARVTYSNARNVRTMIARVEAGDSPRPGMKVYVNPDDCRQAMHLAKS